MSDSPALDVPVGFVGWSLITTTMSSDVYVANTVADGTATAVKILRVDADEDVNRLFLEGTEAAAEVPPHPLVLPITRRGLTPGGRPWVAMPYLRYGSLSDRLSAEGPLDPRLATEIFVWVADALAFLSSNGVLHRDIKPGNILFDAEGRPVLADFQTSTRLRPGRQSATTASLTDRYAAAEVLVHGRYTVQSEVFSVCASLLQALGGRPPHEMRAGEPLGAYLKRIGTGTAIEQVDLLGVPRPLTAVVCQGLAHDPDLRPSGPSGLSAALRSVQATMGWPVTGEISTASPPNPPTVVHRRRQPSAPPVAGSDSGSAVRRSGHRLAVLVAAALALGGVGATVAADWQPTGSASAADGAGSSTEAGSSAGSTPVASEGGTVKPPGPSGQAVPGSGPDLPTAGTGDGGATLPSGGAGEEQAAPVRGGAGHEAADGGQTDGGGGEVPVPVPVPVPSPVSVPMLGIAASTVHDATVGRAYQASFTPTGGKAPYTWGLVAGRLPGGLSLHSDGTISGTPFEAATVEFTLQVRDAAGQTATAEHDVSAAVVRGDITRDGEVDCADQAVLVAAHGSVGSGLAADLDGDGTVGAADLAIMLGHWTGPSGDC